MINIIFDKKYILKTIDKIKSKLTDNPIFTIVLFGIFIRFLLSFVYQHITLYPDSVGYVQLAERLLKFNLEGYQGERAPGYPLLLSLSGLSTTVTVILQLLMGICTLVVTYKTLILINIQEKQSLIITLLGACYLPAIFFELSILTETLTLFIISIIFFKFFQILKMQETNFIPLAIISLFIGFLVLIKPFYIFLPVILLSIFICKNKKSKFSLVKYSIIIIIPFSLYFGWSYVNKINTGYLVPTTYYGFNLAQNCVSFAENTSPEYKEIGEIYAKHRDNKISDKEIAMTIWEAYPELEERTGLSFPELSSLLYNYSIETIRLNPTSYLKQVFISWKDFWKTSLYWEPYNFKIPQASNVVLYICYLERIILQLIKILFALLTPYNILLIISNKNIKNASIISIIVFAASILQAISTYGTNSRFSFPFETLMVVSVVLNIFHFVNIYKKRKMIS